MDGITTTLATLKPHQGIWGLLQSKLVLATHFL